MNNNIIKQKVKPNLTSNEKQRYTQAAEFFMKGSSNFYISHYNQVKKIVDFEAIQNKIKKAYEKTFSEFKDKLKENVDYLKEYSKQGVSRFIDFVLDTSIVILGIFALMPNKIKDILKSIKTFGSNLLDKTGLKDIDYFDVFCKFIRTSVSTGLDIGGELISISKYMIDYFHEILSTFWSGAEMFFYSDIFNTMMRDVAVTAFNRSFDSSFGKVAAMFFSKLSLEIRKRPELYNYAMFGSSKLLEITEHIKSANEMLGEVGLTKSGTQLVSGWTFKLKGDWARKIDNSDDVQFLQDNIQEAMRLLTNVANGLITDYRTGALQMADNNYENTKEYLEALEIIKKINEHKFSIDGHMLWFGDEKGSTLTYRDDKGKIKLLYNKIETFISLSSIRDSVDPLVIKVLDKWSVIKKKIDESPKPNWQQLNINVEDALMMNLYYMILFSKVEENKIKNRNVVEFDYHNVTKKSKLTGIHDLLMNINITLSNADRFSGITDVKSAYEVFENYKNKILSDTDLMKCIKLDFKTQNGVDIYRLGLKIKEVYDYLSEIQYKKAGVGDNIYFYNTYSKMSDYEEIRERHARTIGESEDANEIDETSLIQNSTTTEEISEKIINQYSNIKKTEYGLRYEREVLLAKLEEKFRELDNLYKDTDTENQLRVQQLNYISSEKDKIKNKIKSNIELLVEKDLVKNKDEFTKEIEEEYRILLS